MTLINLAALLPLIITLILLHTQNVTRSTICFAIFFGFISIILFIYFNLAYNFVFFILIDNPDIKPHKTFAISRILLSGKCLKLLYIYLNFIGYNILSLMSFGLGFLWVSPYKYQTITSYYVFLLQEQNA